MTFYNNFLNMSTNYFNELNNWFTSLSMSSKFNWTFPQLFSNDFNCSNFDFSNIFTSDAWNTPQNIDWQSNNIFSDYDITTPTINSDTFTRSKRSGSTLQLKLADKAKSYLGRINSDSEGNRLFSNGVNQPWCADFVSYTIRETFGSKLPYSFRHFSSVNGLREWGKSNGCYSEMPSSGKADYIAQNVKVGDIMIEKKGGKSHTGIVTKVNSDGSFETVEGNCGNKVAAQHYTADSPTLSGFISLDRYTA